MADEFWLMVRFMRSTWPLVLEWFGLVRRCSMWFALQIMSKRMGRDQAVLRLRGCSANWMPLSVRTVWMR